MEHTDTRWSEFVSGVPAILELLGKMFPPDWGYALQLWKPVVETLQVGIASTVIASVVAIPLAFLSARNFAPHPVIYFACRMVLTVFRGVSEIIWALLFVVAVGLGPFAGVLALIIFASGVIAKLLSEALEAVDPGPLDAMSAAGAPRWKVFLYAAWPQVLPNFLSYSLYYWDHNTRQAAVLGFVGAGGIGYTLLFNLNTYYFDKAVTALLVLIVLITAIDRLCLWMRARIA
jgi:phosphonate transport system permease protein